MVRTGLDRLQKEIDTLTYNARSVLNALIRSVTTSGSSQGYKATRGGEDIYLSRVDIYRIYKFYQDWENNEFAVDNVNATVDQKGLTGFDDLVTQHDLTPVKNEAGEIDDSSATTNALINHSKIMYQTEENKDNTDSYWLNLIKNSNNAKGIANSSPIPINLRTPILDENLSTTRYNQHPTYLFPMGYFSRDSLGFSGDEVDHRMEGQSWTMQGDNYIRIEAPIVSIGEVDSAASLKTTEVRTGIGSTSFGVDTHAQGQYCIAGGAQSMVPDNSLKDEDGQTDTLGAIALGYQNIASFHQASAIGGNLNSASGRNSSVIGGYGNKATGRDSIILGGVSNTVGGKVYKFYFSGDATTSPDSEPGVEDTSVNNIIIVKGDITSEIIEGDTIRLSDFTIKSETAGSGILYYQQQGDGDKSFNAIVEGIKYHSIDESGVNKTYTQLNISKNVPRKNIIDGGSISVVKRAISGETVKFGSSSAAIGEGLISTGQNQVVVGKYNQVRFGTGLNTPNFIVGTGDSSTDADRKNTLEVYKRNVFIYGSNNHTDYFNPAADITAKESYRNFTGMRFSNRGLEVHASINRLRMHRSTNSGFEFVGNVDLKNEYRIEAISTRGINLFTGNRSITLRSVTQDTLESEGFTAVSGTRNVILQAQDNVMIESLDQITLKTRDQSAINLEFGTLALLGETFGALPTSDKQFSHATATSSDDNGWTIGGLNYGIMAIYNSGFYGLRTDKDPILGYDEEGLNRAEETDVTTKIIGRDAAADTTGGLVAGYHLLNIGFQSTNDDVYYNWQMMFGAEPTYTDARIGVRRGTHRTGWLGANAVDGGNINYLAWLKDSQYRQYTGTNEYTLTNDGEWLKADQSDFNFWKGANATVQHFPIPPFAPESKLPLTDVTMDLFYTKVGKTVFFEMKIQFGELPSLTTSTVSAIVIELPDTNAISNTISIQPHVGYEISPPTFSCSTHYRTVSIGEPQKWSLYTMQVTRMSSEGNHAFVITRSGDTEPNSASNTRNNLFSSELDVTGAANPISFSGFYQAVNS